MYGSVGHFTNYRSKGSYRERPVKVEEVVKSTKERTVVRNNRDTAGIINEGVMLAD